MLPSPSPHIWITLLKHSGTKWENDKDLNPNTPFNVNSYLQAIKLDITSIIIYKYPCPVHKTVFTFEVIHITSFILLYTALIKINTYCVIIPKQSYNYIPITCLGAAVLHDRNKYYLNITIIDFQMLATTLINLQYNLVLNLIIMEIFHVSDSIIYF